MGTNTGTVMTLANSIIGVGVLAMPFCFKQCGIILSIVMLLFSSCLSRLACHFLLKAAIMARRRNFEFLAFHTFGPSGKTIVELCIIGFLMGTCIAFFVVVGDLGPVIVAKTLNITNSPSLRQSVLIGLAVFVVLPLGLLRNVDSLTSICTASIGFYLCLVLKVMAEAMPHLIAADWVEKVYFWRPAGVLQCIPIFSMALFCQTQLFEIYESLPNANLDKMNDVIRAAVSLCTAFYICVGFFGYVAFCTQNFSGNVLMSFTPTLMSDVIKMGFVLSVAVSFPLAIFPCRASLYSLLFKRIHMSHHETLSSHIPEARFKCLTVGIISASLTVGLLIPNIELVLGLVGSTIGVLICVMFPAVAFICISTKSTKERLFAQVLVFVGVLILVLGTYATLYAANEASDAAAVEANSPPSEHLDSVVRMSHIQVDKPVPDDIAEDIEHQNIDKPESKVKLKDSMAEGKQENPPADVKKDPHGNPQPDLKINADGDTKLEVRQEPPVPVEPDKKTDVRKEPPVPVEPDKPVVRQEPPVPIKAAGDQPVVPTPVPENTVEKKDKDVEPPAQQHDEQIEETAHEDSMINKDVVGGSSLEKKKLPESSLGKGKGNNEEVNQDAIRKEDEELAEAAKQAEDDDKEKKEELLRKLEMHQEEQKKLLQEQKQILQELKEQKKEIEEAAAKQRNDDNEISLPKVKENSAVIPAEKSETLLQNDSHNNLAAKNKLPVEVGNQNSVKAENSAPVVKKVEVENVANEVEKPQDGVPHGNKLEKQDPLTQHMKLVSSDKLSPAVSGQQLAGLQKNMNLQQSHPQLLDLMTKEKLKGPNPDADKMENVKAVVPDVSSAHKLQGTSNNNAETSVNRKEQPESKNLPESLPKRLALPLPLARDNASKLYKLQQDTKNKTVSQIVKADNVIDSQKDDNIHQSNAVVNEAKVMRRDILSNTNNDSKTNIVQEKTIENLGKDTGAGAKQRDILSSIGNNDQKIDDHERQKRDTLLEEILQDDKDLLSAANKKEVRPDVSHLLHGHVSQNCEANEKHNERQEETVDSDKFLKEKPKVTTNPDSLGKETLPVAVMSNDPKLSNIETVPSSIILERKLNNPEIAESVQDSPVEHHDVPEMVHLTQEFENKLDPKETLKTEIKIQMKSEEKPSKSENIAVNADEILSTLSSLIKTPLYLSDPKLGEGDFNRLSEAVVKGNDIRIIAKPMSRDLKSVSGTQQAQEEKESKEKSSE